MHTIAIAGAGTVGAALIQSVLASVPIRLKAVLVRDAGKPRPGLPTGLDYVTDPAAILADPEIDTVVELMGGTGAAFELASGALAAGKHLVTANKNLLAERGPELFALARDKGRSIGFEAAVCAGMPVIRALQEALRADRVSAIEGILNGTTNYILTRMAEDNLDYAAALAQAQRLGFAEPDPANDVSGVDAACKLGILAALAFHRRVEWRAIPAQGIQDLQAEDLRQAARMGYRVKLLARAALDQNGRLDSTVGPALIPVGHPLAAVRDEFNALMVASDGFGRNLFMGKGAGPAPTAASLLADILDIAQGRGWPVGADHPFLAGPAPAGAGAAPCRLYLRLAVPDRPGVLAAVAGRFAEAGVSIASVLQPETAGGGGPVLVPLILTTHAAATEAAARLRETLAEPGRPAPVVLPIVDD
jgi:homoserine dehydrogenase